MVPPGGFNPPPTEGVHGVLDPIPYLGFCLQSSFQQVLSKRSYGILSSPLLNSLPRRGGDTAIQPSKVRNIALVHIFFRFFALPNVIPNFASKKTRKKLKNQGFWSPKTLPKSSQNPLKNGFPKNMQFFIDFGSKTLLLQKCRHQQNIGFYQSEWLSDVFLRVAFCMDFRSQKPSKNLSKTIPERLQNPS